jgi:soluble lytic murein transglycosylase-like protein
MVRTIGLGLAFGLVLSGAAAAKPDWRTAGGNLFVEAASLPATAPRGLPTIAEAPQGGAGARLPDLDQPFSDAVAQAASVHGLDPKLLHALVVVESGYRPTAVSPAGARGLTQLMPATAASLGVRDRFDPRANLSGGADYLARLLLRFGDLRLALAAYNSGPARVAELGRVPNIAETRAYVGAVINCYLALSAGRAVRSADQCRGPGAAP